MTCGRLVRPWIVLLCLCLTFSGVTGCSGWSGAPRASGDGGGIGGGTALPIASQIDPDNQPAIRLEPAWTVTFDRPVAATIAFGGGVALVGRSYGSVRNSTNWSAVLYAADGTMLWEQSYARDKYRTIEVDVLGNVPYCAVAAYKYNNGGDLLVYSAAGDLLWTREVSMSVSLRIDPAGEWIAGIDRGKETLFIVQSATGHELATRAVSGETALDVAADGNILLSEPASWTLIEATGKVLWRSAGDLRYAAVATTTDGDGVCAATGGGDSTVHRYRLDGSIAWQTSLPPGGSNNLAVSPDGRYLAAFNVGLGHGLTILDAVDGQRLLDVSIDAAAGAAAQFAKWVRFLPGDRGLLVDLVVVRDPGGVHSEEHSILWLDRQGGLLGQSKFGANVDVQVAADGQKALVVVTAPLDPGGSSTNRIMYYDLAPLFGR